MRELPIPFSGPMVRADLGVRKTTTRRVAKTVKHPDFGCEIAPFELVLEPAHVIERTSAYGQPGDRLWVREAWRVPAILDGLSGKQIAEACLAAGYRTPWCPIQFEADGSRNSEKDWREFGSTPGEAKPGRYRHARFMPRWASRITLEVTDVRVERLQDGEGEADWESRYLAEGITRIHHGDGEYYYSAFRKDPDPKNWVDPFDAWRELWISINGQSSWDANPHVWVIEFKRVTP